VVQAVEEPLVATNRAGGSVAVGAVDMLIVYLKATDVGATETVTIGAGGSGGASQTADTTSWSMKVLPEETPHLARF
jgi:hypothetical protein